LKNGVVGRNLARLESEDVTFELHVNPHQYDDALALLKTVPGLRVIINHLGSPKMENIKSEKYLDQMRQFASLPNVFLKVSFFGFITPSKNEQDLALIIEVSKSLIKIFTPERCMFATNFPVDNHDQFGSWTITDLSRVMKSIAEPFTSDE